MSAKPLSLAALLSLVMAWPAAAQPPGPPAPIEIAPAPAPSGSANTLLPNGYTPLPGTAGSRWVEENSALPVGGNGPIGQELYFNTGLNMALGNGIFGLYTHPGWMIDTGGRALWFNVPNSGAMTGAIGFTYQENIGKQDAPTYKFFGIDVRTRSLIRCSAVSRVGYDWFRQGQGPFGWGNTFRFGADVGGRWGTEILYLDVINDPVQNTTFRRRSDVFGGVVAGIHADIEIPMRSWVWFGGLRWEYGYNWSNLLPGQNSNIHDINTLMEFGFRY
jgi:hypothetical protein